MFVGIVAMIAAVLVGTLGKDFLLSINAQIFGFSPTYSLSIAGSNFTNAEKMEQLIEGLQKDASRAIVIRPSKATMFARMENLQQLKESENLYKSLSHVEVIYTTSAYDEIYNVPIFKGRWFDKIQKDSSLEVVVNKHGYSTYDSKYVVLSRKDSLNLTPFNLIGVINDGKDWPVIYVNIKPLLATMPSLLEADSGTVYWHGGEELNHEKLRTNMEDLLYDTIGGTVENVARSDSSDSYAQVVSMLQLGLIISATLLLFVAVLGQINIGLSSLEQRTRELLIRRALGASKINIAILVSSSLLFLSIIVCVVSIVFSMALTNSIHFFLPPDTPIRLPEYPVTAALIAVGCSVFTALLGGLIPAIKASRLEPALALR